MYDPIGLYAVRRTRKSTLMTPVIYCWQII